MADERPLVHVIDDDAAMRDSLVFMLEVQGYEVRAWPTAEAFLQMAEDGAAPVVTDVRMPGMNGLDLVRKLRADGRRHPVVVMTGHGDVPLAVEAMKAGAADFIEKPFSDDILLDRLRSVRTAREPDAADDGERAEALERFAGLSPRERDVLLGVVAGKANKVIAYELDISPRTVEVYRANLMAKTGARNLSELMRLALAAGL